MPITGPASYVSTTEEFEQHWATANAMLGAGNEIVLPDGTSQAGLVAKKGELVAKRADVQAKLNFKEVARGDLELKKAALLERIVQFNEKVRAFFPGSKWINALPNAPGQAEGQSRISDPLDDANSLWLQINADPGTAAVVTLLGGYTQATFDTDIAALKAAYTTLNGAETTLKVTREERNDLQEEIYARLKSYRAVLPTFFAKDDGMVLSLPRLTPLPGSTPAAITASGEWVPTPGHGLITWTASSDPALDHYDIRMTPGPVYDADLDSKIGEVGPGLNSFTTLIGLEAPGNTASYRVFVILSSGNESGSNSVVITRP